MGSALSCTVLEPCDYVSICAPFSLVPKAVQQLARRVCVCSAFLPYIMTSVRKGGAVTGCGADSMHSYRRIAVGIYVLVVIVRALELIGTQSIVDLVR